MGRLIQWNLISLDGYFEGEKSRSRDSGILLGKETHNGRAA
jgi:hypothetical protein